MILGINVKIKCDKKSVIIGYCVDEQKQRDHSSWHNYGDVDCVFYKNSLFNELVVNDHYLDPYTMR